MFSYTRITVEHVVRGQELGFVIRNIRSQGASDFEVAVG